MIDLHSAQTMSACHRVEVTSLAARHRLPALYNYRSFTEVGGLMSYGMIPSSITGARRHTFIAF
jgi:hypothetical protein